MKISFKFKFKFEIDFRNVRVCEWLAAAAP